MDIQKAKSIADLIRKIDSLENELTYCSIDHQLTYEVFYEVYKKNDTVGREWRSHRVSLPLEVLIVYFRDKKSKILKEIEKLKQDLAEIDCK